MEETIHHGTGKNVNKKQPRQAELLFINRNRRDIVSAARANTLRILPCRNHKDIYMLPRLPYYQLNNNIHSIRR